MSSIQRGDAILPSYFSLPPRKIVLYTLLGNFWQLRVSYLPPHSGGPCMQTLNEIIWVTLGWVPFLQEEHGHALLNNNQWGTEVWHGWTIQGANVMTTAYHQHPNRKQAPASIHVALPALYSVCVSTLLLQCGQVAYTGNWSKLSSCTVDTPEIKW